jgi:ADP-ribose pyrophosphatase YjhB (NUDIX family)
MLWISVTLIFVYRLLHLPGQHNQKEHGSWAKSGNYHHAGSNTDAGVAIQKTYGEHGAAGLLITHKNPITRRRKYLVQTRGPGVQHPGTVSTIGGALNKGETPWQGAVREAREEEGIKLPKGSKVISKSVATPKPGWQYTTYTVNVKKKPTTVSRAAESQGTKWVTQRQLEQMNLHPGFAQHVAKQTAASKRKR